MKGIYEMNRFTLMLIVLVLCASGCSSLNSNKIDPSQLSAAQSIHSRH